jgi:phosphoribosylformylglycinamidine (FGAM) synthase-like enzyme/phosphoribosylformylglycinamidine (FGAM) synthase PurS component
MPATAAPTPTVHRFEVSLQPDIDDPRADSVLREAREIGIGLSSARVSRIYLIEAAALDDATAARIRDELLANPVTEEATAGARPALGALIEVHPLPGVMDPAAISVQEALADLYGVEAKVSTGWRYDLAGAGEADARRLAERLLANPVIHAIHTAPFLPDRLPAGASYTLKITHVPLRELDDAALQRLSRESHLFLSLDEMRTIRDHYKQLGREPTDIELETLAQTWSEHCVHKTLKSRIRYSDGATRRRDGGGADRIRWEGRPGHQIQPDGSIVIDNLLKRTVAAATFELIGEGLDWTLSVFEDNAGVIAFDDDHAVCIKVETHNHPSAIEPYGGAATGIGGCIRDIIGTGLAAKPICSTDVFCVADPNTPQQDVPAGCLHPKRILAQVVAGVRDYGNRMGIPTVNGAVLFDDRFIGNPLVFCGCVGIMPRDMIHGKARPGDRIIALGGRTGRDGIHGATFSSAELTDTHADEFSHAVQIGNAITEKKLLDAILRARDAEGGCLFTAITDCGAGGFSSAVGEMGADIGAEVDLEQAPLKYDGLSYTEIWISEAQERMVLSVPEKNLPALQAICDEEGVELANLGRFGATDAELILRHRAEEVGRLSMNFLHEGLPKLEREAHWVAPRSAGGGRQDDAQTTETSGDGTATQQAPPGGADTQAAPAERGATQGAARTPAQAIEAALPSLLAHPDIASKHWIIRQYDHEVQSRTAIKPLVGPLGRGPGDAAVIEPVPGSGRGLAIACGIHIASGDPAAGGDPYEMALAGIDECVRNLVCVGADPDRIAILDNFCWPGVDDPESLGALVRAAEGCYDGAKAYRTPFVSGKDSLNNQFTTEDGRTIRIPPTLLITGVGIVPDIERAITMDAKRPGSILLLVGDPAPSLGASRFAAMKGAESSATSGAGLHPAGDALPIPQVDLTKGPATARAVAKLIRRGMVLSAHDISDGGLLCALAEMLIAGFTPETAIGATIDLSAAAAPGADPLAAAFSEAPSRYLLEVDPAHIDAALESLATAGPDRGAPPPPPPPPPPPAPPPPGGARRRRENREK